MSRFFCSILLPTIVLASDGPWEWIGSFELTQAAPHVYTWTSQKKDGGFFCFFFLSFFGASFGSFHVTHTHTHANETYTLTTVYAATTAKFLMKKTTEAGHEGIESVEAAMESTWGSSASTVNGGAVLSPNTLYTLTFNDASYQTTFDINVGSLTGHYVIAFEHKTSEFEDSVHYLKNAAGTDITGHVAKGGATAAVAVVAHHDDDHLVLALGANVISTACTLIGVLVLFLGTKATAKFTNALECFSLPFAAGALLGAAFFLSAPAPRKRDEKGR